MVQIEWKESLHLDIKNHKGQMKVFLLEVK